MAQMKEERIREGALKIVSAEMSNPSSPLRQKIYESFYQGEKAEARGDWAEARKYYGEVSRLGRAAQQRTATYVKELDSQVEELRKKDLLAEEYYKDGNYEKAKEVWQKIKEDAKLKPLTVEIE
jgi:tetratricopeptide (TPR) repeat protein